jgi:hypothetical protein
MSRSSLRVRDYTHVGEGRLIQLRQLVKATMQLKHKIAKNHDQPRSYMEK